MGARPGFGWLLLAWLAVLAPAGAGAQTISVSGDPGTLTVSTATAGLPPDAVVNATTTYSVSAVAAASRIAARLDSPLPSGVTLTVELQAPSGATSAGPVQLTTTDQDVVRDIPAGSHSALTITYTLSATAAAGVQALTTRTVTFTVAEQL